MNAMTNILLAGEVGQLELYIFSNLTLINMKALTNDKPAIRKKS